MLNLKSTTETGDEDELEILEHVPLLGWKRKTSFESFDFVTANSIADNYILNYL